MTNLASFALITGVTGQDWTYGRLPNRKCLLGIISGKFTSHPTEGDREIAGWRW
jgi:hypothetical protein